MSYYLFITFNCTCLSRFLNLSLIDTLMEDISSTIILQNIRVLRQERKYSQEYMALRLTFSQNAYSKLERGLTRLTLERLAQIAEILGTTLSELIKEPVEEKAGE